MASGQLSPLYQNLNIIRQNISILNFHKKPDEKQALGII